MLVVLDGTTDEEICMPGNSTINMHTLIKEEMPMDLLIKASCRFINSKNKVLTLETFK